MVTLKLKEPLSDRTLSTREQIILLEASRLHGCLFPPWKASPDANEFDLGKDQLMFIDDVDLRLSAAQLAVFDGWKRPDDLLHSGGGQESSKYSLTAPATNASPKIDLVQDVTSDCSVVASLCACVARTQRGHPTLLSSIFHPYDQVRQQPTTSGNGKYLFRLYFNGCWRKVVIDDRLPSSNGTRTLYVIDRNHPSLLWPALIEKAYLKIRGGYDFPGSNSGSDLWILTGWIPEQVFLHSDDIEREALWRRMLKAFEYGDLLITLGTGKVSESEERSTGLAGEHDYAVIDLQERSGKRLFLVKNPWSEGNRWSEGDETNGGVDSKEPSAGLGHASSEEVEAKRAVLDPGTFWMNINDVFQYFETLYLNWNSSLFSYRQDVHFSWDLTGRNGLWASFGNNPQYQIHSKATSTVWLVLSRHFKSSHGPNSSSDKSPPRTSAIDTGFISLYLFRRGGERVFLTDGFTARGPYVDSPNTLLKVQLPKDVPHTIVVSEQDLHQSSYSFTLSAFSLQPLTVTEAQNRYGSQTVKVDAWTSESAGGNASSPSYSKNPQFCLDLPQPSDVSLLLELHSGEFPVHVKLIWSDGKPVRHVGTRDIVGDSGEYRKGHAFAEIPNVPSGRYTVVCSTFEEGQLAKFTLQIGTMSACTVERVYARPAGQFVTRPGLALFAGETDRLWAPLGCSRLTRLSVSAQTAGRAGRTSSRVGSSGLPLKVSVEYGQGLMKRTLAVSGNDDFSDGHYGVQVNDVDIQPSMCTRAGVRIVLERAGPLGLRCEEGVEVEVHSDANVQVGSWYGLP